jgi:hypothetical protein
LPSSPVTLPLVAFADGVMRYRILAKPFPLCIKPRTAPCPSARHSCIIHLGVQSGQRTLEANEHRLQESRGPIPYVRNPVYGRPSRLAALVGVMSRAR